MDYISTRLKTGQALPQTNSLTLRTKTDGTKSEVCQVIRFRRLKAKEEPESQRQRTSPVLRQDRGGIRTRHNRVSAEGGVSSEESARIADTETLSSRLSQQ